jgi:hypothetical protein
LKFCNSPMGVRHHFSRKRERVGKSVYGGNKFAEEREGANAPRAGGWVKEGGSYGQGEYRKTSMGVSHHLFKKVTDTVLGVSWELWTWGVLQESG